MTARLAADSRDARDELALDQRDTLEALSARWGAVYAVTYDGHRWLADRKDGTRETLCGLTPDDLTAAIRTDWADWPRGASW